MKRPPTRRQLLHGLTTSLGGLLAGCSTPVERRTRSPSPVPTPTPEETPTPTLTPGEPTATPTDTPVHILTDYGQHGWGRIWERELLPAFERELGLTVEVTHHWAGGGAVQQRIRTLLDADQPPESVTGQLGAFADLLLIGGRYAPVTSAVDRLTSANGELVGEPATIAGEHYIVPYGTYTDTIHYRADILDRFGLDPPTTIEQLVHNSSVIERSGDENLHGFALPAAKRGQSEAWLKVFLNVFGAHLWQWDSQQREQAAVWFPAEKVRNVLELARNLDPSDHDSSSRNWGSSVRAWATGEESAGSSSPRFAMMYHLNAWGAGVAAQEGNHEIVQNTEILPLPTANAVTPFARGRPGFDGFSAINGADNLPGLFAALRYMFDNPDRAARYYSPDPMRYLPAYSDIVETDTYQAIDLFREYPHLLDLNRKARDEIAPLEPSSKQVVMTPATFYAESFNITGQLMHQVIVEDRSIDPAIQDAREQLTQRLDEGQRLVEKHFDS